MKHHFLTLAAILMIVAPHPSCKSRPGNTTPVSAGNSTTPAPAQQNAGNNNLKTVEEVAPVNADLQEVNTVVEVVEGDPGGVDETLLSGNTNTDDVVTYAELMPRFNGNLDAYLKENLRYPQAAVESNSSAKILVQFVVGTDGVIDRSTISTTGKKTGLGFEEEAIRVVSGMPAWLPGKQNGKAVKVRYTLVANFEPHK